MEESNFNEDLIEDPLEKTRESYRIAKEVYRGIDQIVEEIKADLKMEREGIPKDKNKIKTEILKKQYESNKIQRESEKLKIRAKYHKGAIDQWKRWHESITEDDKTQEKEKMLSEINRRGAEIKKIEEEIGMLFLKETKIKEEIDKLNIKLQIFDQDRVDGPIEQDPRLVVLLNQQQEAKIALESAHMELKNLKKERNQAEVSN